MVVIKEDVDQNIPMMNLIQWLKNVVVAEDPNLVAENQNLTAEDLNHVAEDLNRAGAQVSADPEDVVLADLVEADLDDAVLVNADQEDVDQEDTKKYNNMTNNKIYRFIIIYK